MYVAREGALEYLVIRAAMQAGEQFEIRTFRGSWREGEKEEGEDGRGRKRLKERKAVGVEESCS